MKKFSKDIAEESLETITKKIEGAVVKYGDEGLEAIRKIGPRAVQLADEAGEAGSASVKLMAKYGEDSLWLVGKQSRMGIVAAHGDDAATALIRQGEIAEPLIKSLGSPAAKALSNVSTQNGRRIAMMVDEGMISKAGSRAEDLMNVIAKFGDKGMEFIWKNKAALAIGTTLAAFLSDPQPFIDGTLDLSKVAATSVVEPIAREVALKTNWTAVLMTMVVGSFGVYILRKFWSRNSKSV
ncbi:MAG: hypothetical protein NTW52_03960 [Planctomycetota bacterium]|nr:hypothetical protein [Planctomycetota bacterium]